jgi:hypothetical protein
MHHRFNACVEHVIAPDNDRQILEQGRRRGEATNHNLQVTAEP